MQGPAYKHDLAAGKTLLHKYGKGRVTLEPLFVPRHDSAAKGAPVATIHLPVRVPFGFHGTWIPDP